jgi:glycerophosphoryl diester phosphodiesterase
MHTESGRNQPLVIAHRGASGYLPEHTEGAKVLAHAQGADFIEQDVVLSRDGIAVVCHDVTLESTSDVAKRFPSRRREDGHFYVIDFDLDELKQLKIVERFRADTGEAYFPTRFRSDFASRILTLQEEISLIQGLNQTTGRTAGIYPEIKRGAWHDQQTGVPMWRQVWEICQTAGYATAEDPCFIQSFEAEDLRALHDAGCQLRLIQLLGEAPVDAPVADQDTWASEIARYAHGIGPAIDLVVDRQGKPTGIVAAAHRAGLVIHPYTVREDSLPPWSASIDELYATLVQTCGVDGFFTDHPRTAVEYLRQR